MFDIGFSEILVILTIGLVVLGPERLPGAVKTVLYWVRKARASIDEAKAHINEELNTDEIKKNIAHYNDQLKSAEQRVKSSLDVDRVNEHTGRMFSRKRTRSSAAPATGTDKPAPKAGAKTSRKARSGSASKRTATASASGTKNKTDRVRAS